ncbi:hypothetical protein MIR68_006234 [Amoeboaphelidium protococcarum]|nr:hypothetical protein MIR68_006234 [Amoeboaphelidium protococcarum]
MFRIRATSSISLRQSQRRLVQIADDTRTQPPNAREIRLLNQLQERGLVHTTTYANYNRDANFGQAVYTGFDPTAKSLHLGNLLSIITLIRFDLQNVNTLCLVGGATGFIGDPSGKSVERQLLSQDDVLRNSQAISAQIQTVYNRIRSYAQQNDVVDNVELPKATMQIVNNMSWFQNINFVQFMRDIGKMVRVSDMLGRDSVKSRLSSTSGISFTEFSYQLMQAYDFLHLYKMYDCRLQIGGSDQWGNITAGTELINKIYQSQNRAHGLVYPLLTTKSGEKFGKSAGNAIWLDPQLTSPYDFYQFFSQVPDDQLEIFFKQFTFKCKKQNQAICSKHSQKPELHYGQQTLAAVMTEMVHGEEAMKRVRKCQDLLFRTKVEDMSVELIRSLFDTNDSRILSMRKSDMRQPYPKLLHKVAGNPDDSIAKYRKLIKNGGIYLNGVKEKDIHHIPLRSVKNNILKVQFGKHDRKIVIIDEE